MCINDKVEDFCNINLDESRYDQDTYCGRVKQCFLSINPFNLFVSSEKLEEARCLVLRYKCNEPLPEDVTEEDLWKAKNLYESAYNPKTGEKLNSLCRPSVRLPINALITGGMLAFYKTLPAVVCWQWLNQSYIALVNHMNKTGTDTQILTSYGVGTGAAVGTALGLNHMLRGASSLTRRFVPLVAVVTANILTTPLMRAQDLKNGIPVYDECMNKIGFSKVAAQTSVNHTILNKSAVLMPGMILTPIFMDYLEKRGTLCRYPWMNYPATVGLLSLCLIFLAPMACGLSHDEGHMPYKHLDPELIVV